jgi:DNA-binding winged helix-turn-helix (wHTH) protein/tetratricopeptide (TPR) repeat protein
VAIHSRLAMDTSGQIFRFGPYESRCRSRELYKHGRKLKVRPQPLQLLNVLVSHAGEVVTREELRQELWSSETFVDFEHGLNTSVKELRAVLGDSALQPQYIQTLPRLGYRFITPVEVIEPHVNLFPSQPTVAAIPSTERLRNTHGNPYLWLFATLVVTGTVVGGFWYHRPHRFQITPRDTIVLADFVNTTGETVFNDALKQGLHVGLEQSPMVRIFSGDKSAAIVEQMGHPTDQPVTGRTAIEVCQRTGSKVTVQGSISNLGTTYLIGLTAIRCDNGERIADEQVEAKRKEDVIDALGKATSRFRSRLGESLPSIKEYDAPLEQATTSSLEALKAYGIGLSKSEKLGDLAAVPFFNRAIELDPNFALAYGQLAAIYANMSEIELSRKNATKAFELRDRATEFERLSIESWYFTYVTGDLEKADQALEIIRQTYPEAPRSLNDLGSNYGSLGLYDKAVDRYRDSLQLDPMSATTSGNLALSLMALGRDVEAAAVLEEAGKNGPQTDYLLQVNYWRAFLRHDTQQMSHLLTLAAGVPGAKAVLLSAQANTEAYAGHFERGRFLSQAAANQMQVDGHKEAAGLCFAQAAIREVEVGDLARGRYFISKALNLTHNQNVVALSALVMAHTGDSLKAMSFAGQLNREHPSDTFIQKYWLPIIRAETDLYQGKSSQAVEALSVAEPLDWAAPEALDISTLFPAYTRGRAYLAAGDGSKAAEQFQKLIDHPGMVLNYPLGALARLGIARAHRLSQQNNIAIEDYGVFFALWKDADPDIPLLKQAKAEYAKLQ